MKRIISIIAVLAGLSAANASAQSFFAPQEEVNVSRDGAKMFVSIGPAVGVTASSLSSSAGSFENFGTRVGFSAGAFLNLRFLSRNVRSTAETGLLAFQPEVRFTMVGGNSEESNLGLGYIMVPLMLQVYPSADFYIEAGPSLGLNVSHTPDNIVSSGTEFNLTDLKANDVALAVGVGYCFGNLNIGARYYLGFSDLAPNMNWKNRWFEVGVSYSIPLTRQHTNTFFD